MKKLIFLFFPFFFLTACTPQDLGTPATLGSLNTSILIEEFSDFQCPACASIGPQLEELVTLNPSLARLEFHHFPLSYHENAFRAAEAAECANDQGKFWEFARLAFKNQNNLSEDKLISFSEQLNLDQTLFNNCFESGIKRAKIKEDISEGQRRQLSYTPSVYVNGQLVQWTGVEPFEAYLKSLRD